MKRNTLIRSNKLQICIAIHIFETMIKISRIFEAQCKSLGVKASRGLGMMETIVAITPCALPKLYYTLHLQVYDVIRSPGKLGVGQSSVEACIRSEVGHFGGKV